MIDISPLEQLRANRRHRMNGWYARRDGGRWEGDDGRVLARVDIEHMARTIGEQDQATQAKWTAILDAEAAEWAAADAAYETAKAALEG